MTHILVVDPNEAFAMLLVEELKKQGYTVESAGDYQAALSLAEESSPDMVLLDMGLEAPGALDLAQHLRERQASLRLVFIPLMGEDLSPQVADTVSVQGVLSKPFFLPELGDRIEAAFAAPLDGETVEEVPEPMFSDQPEVVAPIAGAEVAPVPETARIAPESSRGLSAKLLAKHRPEVHKLMEGLAQEVSADAVLLTVNNQLSLWVGQLEEQEVEAVAQAAIQGWKTSAEMARILGREQVRFEQSIAGGDYLLYALGVSANAILAVVIRGSVALGLLRHRARGAADQVASICMDETL